MEYPRQLYNLFWCLHRCRLSPWQKKLMAHGKITREQIGGKKKVSMKVHQYEREHLERLISLGTCPLARGSSAPTARAISHVTNIGLVDLYKGRYGRLISFNSTQSYTNCLKTYAGLHSIFIDGEPFDIWSSF